MLRIRDCLIGVIYIMNYKNFCMIFQVFVFFQIINVFLEFNLKRQFLEYCDGFKKVEIKFYGKYRKIKVNVNFRYDLVKFER